MIDGNDEVIERIAAELRAPVHLNAAFDERVMRAVRAESRTGVWGWFVRPRAIRVSPLAGLAYAASLVLAALGGMQLMPGTRAPESAGVTVAQRAPDAAGSAMAAPAQATAHGIAQQFVIRLPRASRVALVGDFNNWSLDATPLTRGPGDVWTVTIPLVPGRYSYNFVVDGTRWVTDPGALQSAGDDFGRPSSVIMVSAT